MAFDAGRRSAASAVGHIHIHIHIIRESCLFVSLVLCLFEGYARFVSGIAVIASLPSEWSKPVIDSVLLPAHAQTSACSTETTVGGPLIGHPSGALNCQEACESEAASQSAELCAVSESVDGSGATQCACDLDLP